MRLGIDGLAAIVKNTFHLNPFHEGVLFLFCGRRTDRIKGLLFEGDGFLLLYKRLENARFQWPRNESAEKGYQKNLTGICLLDLGLILCKTEKFIFSKSAQIRYTNAIIHSFCAVMGRYP
jgi:hypothetical protein